jgi:ribulose-phosphate 3-epimerase
MQQRIIPAVLPKSLEEIEDALLRVKDFVDIVQIDICDGVFTSTSTWPYVQKTLPDIQDDFEMPYWEYLDFEFDLMIQNPHLYIDSLKNMGMSKAVLHIGSCTFEEYVEASKLLEKYQIEVGVGIQADISTDEVLKYMNALKEISITPYIQVMGIKTVGVQRQEFYEKSLDMIRFCKKEFKDILLQVDGSANLDTKDILLEAGADKLVVGSGLFDTQYLQERLKELQSN